MANPSVRGYQSQNLNVLKEGMKMFVKNVAQPQLVSVLRQKAQEVVQLIDSGLIPEYTANLHDATGCAVYADGAISAFIPTKRAQKQGKSGFDGVNHYGIEGSVFLQQAISEASTRFAKGVWFVVFSAVPYAYHIDAHGSPKGRGQDFFKTIRGTAVNDILAGLRAIPNVEVTASPTML
jgi:hypothetical protein